jgi:hypothetical protein
LAVKLWPGRPRLEASRVSRGMLLLTFLYRRDNGSVTEAVGKREKGDTNTNDGKCPGINMNGVIIILSSHATDVE